MGGSGEQSHYVALARFTARTETAGAITAATRVCNALTAQSQNGLEDFVSQCGDSSLAEKRYGGHVLVSWRRAGASAAVDDLMGTMLGARTVGATIDLPANLTLLQKSGLGDLELFIEAVGLPLAPRLVTLPNGQQGYTVDSVAEFLAEVAQHNPAAFVRVTDYRLERFTIDEVDLCLAKTARQSAVAEAEWACIHGHLSELADARDGTGDVAHFQDKYLEAKLVHDALVPAQRVVFNTVPQSRCPGIDDDGDPQFEASGRCQVRALGDFLAFWEACTRESATRLLDCRDTVLGSVQTCDDFEQKDCRAPELTLSSGQTVSCTEAGLAAALADLVPWQVNPPFTPAVPGAFRAPTVFTIEEATNTGALPVTPLTHFCAITGVRGGLHEADFSVEDFGAQWAVFARQRAPTPGTRLQLEVTCTAWENFYSTNGGSHTNPGGALFPVPALNGTGFFGGLSVLGNPVLAGVWGYLDEPQTEVFVTNPSPVGFGGYFAKDLFPATSLRPAIGFYSIQSTPPTSGGPLGGSLGSATPSMPSRYFAGRSFPGRLTDTLSVPLEDDAFCYLAGLSGRYFNASDEARVDRSDGMTTLRTATPLAKDRNPGMRVQCIFYDRP